VSKFTHDADVIIVGGGPAGATAAAILAGLGRTVIVCEKSDPGVYRVGESLIPYCHYPLKHSGALEAVAAAGFQEKRSVQFVAADGHVSKPFYFDDYLGAEVGQTWQVDRPLFDSLLLDNAAKRGARVLRGVTVRDFLRDEEDAVCGVFAEDADGANVALHAPVTIDASGRVALYMSQMGWRHREPALDRIAVWSYFEDAQRDPGRNEGATTIAQLPNDGWVWYLPLANNRASVGVVAKRNQLFGSTRAPDDVLAECIGLNPWIQANLAEATRVAPVRVTADYSYRAQHCAGPGVVLVGDAYGFLDPVFSSGVFLALASGERAALAVHEALETEHPGRYDYTAYGQWFSSGTEAMRAMVHAFYDPSFSMSSMLRSHPELTDDVTDCLVGNLFRDFDALLKVLYDERQVPAPLDVGTAQAPAS